jgi:toxin secretion/phage lysis holin
MIKSIYSHIFNNIIGMQPILFFILMDYITAILVAIYQKKLNSTIGCKGIVKKIGILICVAIVSEMDKLNLFQENIKISPIIIMFFTFNEIISCFENLNKIKIPIPTLLQNILKKIKEKNR